MFNVDIKSMFSTLKREEILRKVESVMKDSNNESWDKDSMKKALSSLWDSNSCNINNSKVKMKDRLSIGSSISSVIAYLVLNEWEKVLISKGMLNYWPFVGMYIIVLECEKVPGGN